MNLKGLNDSNLDHHELSGTYSTFLGPVYKVLEFINSRGNPYSVSKETKLHNIVTGLVVPSDHATRLLNFFQHGESKYNKFMKERFVEKIKLLSDTITKVNLPKFDYAETQCKNKAAQTVETATKHLGQVQRLIDIAKARRLTTSDILTYDHVPAVLLFDDDTSATTKPDKSSLVFHSCAAKQIDFVYNSYLETSIKELEHMRHAKLYNPIDYGNITENTLVPADMDRFWSLHLEILSRDYFIRKASDYKLSIVLSGYVTDAERLQPCVQGKNGVLIVRDDNVEEADERVIPHVAKAVQSGSPNILVLSNDADVVVLLIHYTPKLQQLGLKELWIEYGTGSQRDYTCSYFME